MKSRKKTISLLIIFVFFLLFYLFENNFNLRVQQNINQRIEETPVVSSEKLKVIFLDVGQADSILLENMGKYMLIDAGNNEDGPKLVNYFKQKGITNFQYVIGTHPHEDHIGGLDNIINSFSIDTFYMPDVVTTTKTFEDVLDALENNNVRLSIPNKNDTFQFGNATVKVLYVGDDSEDDLNDVSIVLKVVYQNISFLFMGDASAKVEKKLDRKDLESSVLKVGHHGSSTASDDEFLTLVNPSYAVISVGKNNQYNHPHNTVLNALVSHNIVMYRTDCDGSIEMITDGVNIEVHTINTDTNG